MGLPGSKLKGGEDQGPNILKGTQESKVPPLPAAPETGNLASSTPFIEGQFTSKSQQTLKKYKSERDNRTFQITLYGGSLAAQFNKHPDNKIPAVLAKI